MGQSMLVTGAMVWGEVQVPCPGGLEEGVVGHLSRWDLIMLHFIVLSQELWEKWLRKGPWAD